MVPRHDYGLAFVRLALESGFNVQAKARDEVSEGFRSVGLASNGVHGLFCVWFEGGVGGDRFRREGARHDDGTGPPRR